MAVGVCEVQFEARSFVELLMLRHLTTLVVSHRQTALSFDPIERHAKALHCSLSTTIFHLSQSHKQTCTLNKRADGRSTATNFDEVNFMGGGQSKRELYEASAAIQAQSDSFHGAKSLKA